MESPTDPTHNTPSREPQATPTAGPDRKPHGPDSQHPVAGAASHTDSRPGSKAPRTRLTAPGLRRAADHTDSRPGPKGSSRATAEHPSTATTAPPRTPHPHTLGGSRLRTCAEAPNTVFDARLSKWFDLLGGPPTGTDSGRPSVAVTSPRTSYGKLNVPVRRGPEMRRRPTIVGRPQPPLLRVRLQFLTTVRSVKEL